MCKIVRHKEIYFPFNDGKYSIHNEKKTDVFNYPYICVCDGSIKKVDEHTNENFDLNTKKNNFTLK